MKPNSILIHHVAANNSFYSVNAYHKKKWGFKSKLGWYIGYQYFIDNSGKVFQGREETEEGAHKKGWNNRSIGICLRGNLEEVKPTNQQLNALRELLKDIQKRWGIPNKEIYAHRELSATLCPGKYLMPFIENYRKYIPETTITPTEAPKPVVEPSETPPVAVIAHTLSSLQRQLNNIRSAIIKLLKRLGL